MQMKSSARSFRWFCRFMLMVLAITAVWFFVPRRHEGIRAPLNERPHQELVLIDGRFFEPGGGTPFSGVVLDRYAGGELKSRTVVSNGVLEGLSQGWHTNGQMQVEEHFVAGTSHGLRTKWHPNGQKLSAIPIINGKLHGTFRSWHENGERAEEVELKAGQPDGLSKAWFPSGFQKSQVTLRNGKVVAQKFWKDGEYWEATTTPAPIARN